MTFLRNILLLGALLLGWQPLASAQVFEWTKLAHNKGRNSSTGLGATTDPAGNTYICFSFTDSARVGGQLVRHPGNVPAGMQIARFDSIGRVLWVKPVRGISFSPSSTYNGFQADPVNGGFFVTASFYSTATWDGVPIPGAASLPTGVRAGFYGKCNANGTLLWTRPLPTDINWPSHLTVDGLGNCYLAGMVTGYAQGGSPAMLGGMPIDSTEMFLVGNNAAGSAEWVRRLHASPMPPPATRYDPRLPSGLGELKVGPQQAGGCLLFGSFNQALYFGSPGNPPVLPSRTALNTFDDFIASVSSSGVLTWIRPGRLGNTATTPVPAVGAAAADVTGSYYVTGSSSAGLSVAKYSAAGTLLWATNQAPQSAGSNNAGVLLALDAAGEVTIQADSYLSPSIGNFILSEYQSLIHFNAAGVPQWVAASHSAGDPFPHTTTSESMPVAIGLDARGNVYYVTAPGSYSPNAISPSGSGLTPPTFLLGEHTQVGAGISVARIGTRHNTLRGRLYLDANSNGVRDNGEAGFPRTMVLQAIQPTTARLGTFDTSGSFNVYVGAGPYSLAPPVPPLHYALTQPTTGPYTGSFPGYGRVDTARHFGFRPIPNQADLRATLTAVDAARPGFNVRQRLTLENVGTTTIPAGTATVTLDAQATFVSSNPSATGGRSVRWNYAAIPPFGKRTLDVTFSLPATIALGTVVRTASDATMAGDVLPADNLSAVAQTVSGSFDPNDLEVNYERLSPAQVASQLPLDYLVRFQNMGTDTAFTVVVRDTLDFRRLDLTTLQLVAESHNCGWSVSGTGQLTVRFLNIHLPHRGTNEPGSHGFVRFRVLPKTTLVVGDLVHNKADIFFDYNAPVRTNTATTAVLLPTAMTADSRTTAFTAYPNPAHESLSVAAVLSKAGTLRLSLLDVLGRPVAQQAVAAPTGPLQHTFALRSLAPGLYLLRVQLPDGTTATQRIVVK
jgi:hypothetical protein